MTEPIPTRDRVIKHAPTTAFALGAVLHALQQGGIETLPAEHVPGEPGDTLLFRWWGQAFELTIKQAPMGSLRRFAQRRND